MGNAQGLSIRRNTVLEPFIATSEIGGESPDSKGTRPCPTITLKYRPRHADVPSAISTRTVLPVS